MTGRKPTRDTIALMRDQRQHPENYPWGSPRGGPTTVWGMVNSAYWVWWTDERLEAWRNERDA